MSKQNKSLIDKPDNIINKIYSESLVFNEFLKNKTIELENSIKNLKRKNKKKIVKEKYKLLKKICDDENLDFNIYFDKYIVSNKNTNKNNTDSDEIVTENNDSNKESITIPENVKVLSQVKIKNTKYWKDDNTEILYDFNNYKVIGKFDDDNSISLTQSV